MTFPPYNAIQIEEILAQRTAIAFNENVVDPLVLSYCASKAAQEHGDARKALDLLRISAELAERKEREIVTVEYVNQAQSVMEKDQVRSIISTLPIHYKAALASIILNQGKRENGMQTTGEVYSTYTQICTRFNLSDLSQRRIGYIISELDMQGLINAKIVSLGRRGRTKYISLAIDEKQVKELFKEDSFLSDIIKELEKTGKYIGSTQMRLV